MPTRLRHQEGGGSESTDSELLLEAARVLLEHTRQQRAAPGRPVTDDEDLELKAAQLMLRAHGQRAPQRPSAIERSPRPSAGPSTARHRDRRRRQPRPSSSPEEASNDVIVLSSDDGEQEEDELEHDEHRPRNKRRAREGERVGAEPEDRKRIKAEPISSDGLRLPGAGKDGGSRCTQCVMRNVACLKQKGSHARACQYCAHMRFKCSLV
ncbi:hypothetical protein PUNSTDRAFT_122949 [Punctularia strigosozonata HHB-11173 SS5]|uniref:Uncharacterized protein n=1 Tax=Punctularia strigosozonata (strain HHB-11173) TaxID=741275 RepID=R7S1J1_PUNST|nr:uncharacterized protein PUNSTDRAFT_122949 [Punctularia strigosozonata HHB-11173 SS5]EIN04098.1 hypothetical protein PUNSTDRAFT_122949 [Punctularia strigosozonata HHB-11173 SS5]